MFITGRPRSTNGADQPGLPLGDAVPDEKPLGWIIKPSDSWNFSRIHYQALTYEDLHRYLPGEILANCLWYDAELGAVVVDPMAGSGMTWHVYGDRRLWMPAPKDLDIRMSDLEPRGSYFELISQHDLLDGFPVRHADYILLDLPYFGLVEGCYSDRSGNLANLGVDEYPRGDQGYRSVMCCPLRSSAGCARRSPPHAFTVLLITTIRLHVELWFHEDFPLRPVTNCMTAHFTPADGM